MRMQESQSPTHYVGIGASAGGLEAIDAFFTHMPSNSGLAFIVVQHLSPDYKSLMVELLSKKTTMPVHRAEDGMTVYANHVYLIPPKKNLTIFHGKLLLKDQDPNRGVNLPIDIFLRSLAEDQAENSIAVILSGTGSDGTRGVRAIKEFGGMVMVQDEESAKFDGMPRAAASTGVADFVLPPNEMPLQLMGFVEHPYAAREKRSETLLTDEDGLARIFSELREKTKVDFTYYKPSTITRRIERRMTVNQINDLKDYVRYLQSYPGEVITLYRELLIGVTSFFRDSAAMQELMDNCLPSLLEKSMGQEVRFWVAGCSTGEEAYTIAILAREVMERLHASLDIKVFATDIDRNAIMSAGQGVYPESIAADLTPQLLGKYFYRRGDNYQIARHVREMVVFAQHNLIKDPPFTKTDLVSCRNLLIYLQPVLQQKALEMFNFSLNPGGILFLGTSETVGEMADCFETVHQRHKIYRSKGKVRTLGRTTPIPADKDRYRGDSFPARDALRRSSIPHDNAMITRYLELLSEQYVPLSVIVNEQMEVLHIIGNTDGVFKVPSGRAVYDITKMAARELAIPLATGIQKVFRTEKEMTYTNVPFRHKGEDCNMRLSLFPLPGKKGSDPLVAVFFQKMQQKQAVEQDVGESYDISAEIHQRIQDLEQELQFARENLQATIEELETSNEELQATNEELLASNEELQSTNEELQSTNEELYTVNAEYQNKITELTELHNDVDNLLTSSRIGELFLDENLEIRKFSPEITRLFNVMEKDIGRPVRHLSHHFVDFDPVRTAERVLKEESTFEEEVRTGDGEWFLARILPYHIGPNTYAGVLMTFIEITELKLTRNGLHDSMRTCEDIIEYMPAGLFVFLRDGKGDLRLQRSNPEAERLTGISTEKYIGKRLEEIWPNALESGLLGQACKALQTGETFYLEDVSYERNERNDSFRIHAFSLPGNRLAISFEDITERKKVGLELRESEARFRTLFETMAQGVVYQDAEGNIISANPSSERILGLSLSQMKGRTSMDPRWKAMQEDGSPLSGDAHPSMVALKTGRPVLDFTMGVYNPTLGQTRWILVNAIPEFRKGEAKPWQVYATFDDITERKMMQHESEKRKQQEYSSAAR